VNHLEQGSTPSLINNTFANQSLANNEENLNQFFDNIVGPINSDQKKSRQAPALKQSTVGLAPSEKHCDSGHVAKHFNFEDIQRDTEQAEQIMISSPSPRSRNAARHKHESKTFSQLPKRSPAQFGSTAPQLGGKKNQGKINPVLKQEILRLSSQISKEDNLN
jgi:hypothetical protein